VETLPLDHHISAFSNVFSKLQTGNLLSIIHFRAKVLKSLNWQHFNFKSFELATFLQSFKAQQFLFLLSKSLSNIYRSLIDRNPTDILKKSN
jgi:hypothetical protein